MRIFLKTDITEYFNIGLNSKNKEMKEKLISETEHEAVEIFLMRRDKK